MPFNRMPEFNAGLALLLLIIIIPFALNVCISISQIGSFVDLTGIDISAANLPH